MMKELGPIRERILVVVPKAIRAEHARESAVMGHWAPSIEDCMVLSGAFPFLIT